MKYSLEFSKRADRDISSLKKTDPIAFKKIRKLLGELTEHPYSGTGKPELLKYDYAECYSRRINSKHRLVYSVREELVTVYIIAAIGHYNDK
ncbi:MAG: Txe/YoeB family addiction module toxin [Myroides sp.]|jgi:toxin YoeB|nr:Txe/YoeB family addiction module toxin [Myroides sp.]